jgi:alanine racemase
MRLETIDGVHNSIIINDSYNSDINSLEIALDYLNRKKGNKESMLIMSDIHQSNEQETELCKTVAKILKDKKISNFVGIGEVLGRNKSIFPVGSQFYVNTDSFLDKSAMSAFYDKAVLLKGARDFKFEKISKRLQHKNHLSVVETDLNLMRQNLLHFKSILAPTTKMMVMVKAFSYGSGYREIAAFLQHNRIDYLAVAFADEGTELRQFGIETPVMVMNPNVQSLRTMIEYQLEPEIYSISLLKELAKELNDTNIIDFPIHVKLDTGMHRLGLVSEDIDKFCKTIEESGKIRIASIFSHLSGSDSATFDDFTHEQIRKFEEMYDKISKLTNSKPDRHILNSAGILRFPQYQLEMVRLGIGLYGLIPDLCNKLVPVSQFKSVISQIHKVNKDDTVSYNRSGKMNKDSLIATIPVGYADGLDRRLGNGKWNFVINGQSVPVVGDICMDMCMIDITGVDANEGDEVIIFGPQNSINEMSATLGTIPYEVITGISQRVKRVYFEE